jgi:AmmeMemoRadiSam system protein B
MKRKPAASGRFYPSNATALRGEIEEYVSARGDKRAVVVIVPHAGYDFSGRTAGSVFSEIAVPDIAIILGPNHWGAGSEFAIMSDGAWDMPFGEAQIDSEVAASLKASCPFLQEDAVAHQNEHSLEVEVPFLQYANSNVRIVPIAIASMDPTKLNQLGKCLAQAIQDSDKDILIVASTDMSHTEHSNPAKQEEVHRKDMMAIDAMLELDPGKLLQVVRDNRITMCGPAPVAAALTAAKLLGAEKGRRVSYTTSYDVTGDYNYVVGYAGIIIA